MVRALQDACIVQNPGVVANLVVPNQVGHAWLALEERILNMMPCLSAFSRDVGPAIRRTG